MSSRFIPSESLLFQVKMLERKHAASVDIKERSDIRKFEEELIENAKRRERRECDKKRILDITRQLKKFREFNAADSGAVLT